MFSDNWSSSSLVDFLSTNAHFAMVCRVVCTVTHIAVKAVRASASVIIVVMARAAGLSRAHFSRQFRRTFGESPHAYLLTRRLERAAALLRTTDWSVAEICCAVGLQGIGSFTTSFGRMYGCSPTSYRQAHPSAAALALIPGCVVRAYSRPQHRTFREDDLPTHP